jgi:tRNA-dihydrouridine synthase
MPQKRAADGHYGAYLLQREHWPTVLTCVEEMVKGAGSLAVSCKIRLCSRVEDNTSARVISSKDTVELAKVCVQYAQARDAYTQLTLR